MRSADRFLPQVKRVMPRATLLGLAVAAVALAGTVRPAFAATPASVAGTSAGTSAGTPASAPRAASAPALPPVDPAVQGAYDAAIASLRAGRTADAERALRALAASHPELGGVHANLGLIDRQAGRLDASASELETAVKLSPDQPAFLNQQGITARQRGAFAVAKAAYEHALEVDPNYAAATLNLGILEDLYLGDGARALALYTRYQTLVSPADPQVNKWIADLKNRKAAPGAPAASASAATATATAATSTPARKEKE
jgi:tetratricopeptide (TPR) repeat protein